MSIFAVQTKSDEKRLGRLPKYYAHPGDSKLVMCRNELFKLNMCQKDIGAILTRTTCRTDQQALWVRDRETGGKMDP